MLRSLIKPPCVLFLALLLCGHARAQQPSQTKPHPPAPPDLTTPRETSESDQTPVTEEMLKDAEIKRLEMARKENLERARETAQLGTEVREAFERQKSLGASEMKKIGRLEKLARAIRNEAGGGDDEGLKDPPAQLAAALSRLSELCEELRKRVEKTPRQVVSAAVIASANQVIALAKHIRTFGG
jgi:phage-related tail protein